MEDGRTRRDVCRSMKLPPSNVSTIMKKTYEIKQAVQHAAAVHVTQVSYSRCKLLQKKNGEIIVIWVDDVNKKTAFH